MWYFVCHAILEHCIEVRAYSRADGHSRLGALWKSASFMPYQKDATERKGQNKREREGACFGSRCPSRRPAVHFLPLLATTEERGENVSIGMAQTLQRPERDPRASL